MPNWPLTAPPGYTPAGLDTGPVIEDLRAQHQQFQVDALRDIQDGMSPEAWAAATDKAVEIARKMADAKLQLRVQQINGHVMEHGVMGQPVIQRTMVPGPSQLTMDKLREARDEIEALKLQYTQLDDSFDATRMAYGAMQYMTPGITIEAPPATGTVDNSESVLDHLKRLQGIAPTNQRDAPPLEIPLINHMGGYDPTIVYRPCDCVVDHSAMMVYVCIESCRGVDPCPPADKEGGVSGAYWVPLSVYDALDQEEVAKTLSDHRLKPCVDCGSTANVKWQPCPFESDLYDEEIADPTDPDFVSAILSAFNVESWYDSTDNRNDPDDPRGIHVVVRITPTTALLVEIITSRMEHGTVFASPVHHTGPNWYVASQVAARGGGYGPQHQNVFETPDEVLQHIRKFTNP